MFSVTTIVLVRISMVMMRTILLIVIAMVLLYFHYYPTIVFYCSQSYLYSYSDCNCYSFLAIIILKSLALLPEVLLGGPFLDMRVWEKGNAGSYLAEHMLAGFSV